MPSFSRKLKLFVSAKVISDVRELGGGGKSLSARRGPIGTGSPKTLCPHYHELFFHFLYRHAASWLLPTPSATSWSPSTWDTSSHAPTTDAAWSWRTWAPLSRNPRGWTSWTWTFTPPPIPPGWDTTSRWVFFVGKERSELGRGTLSTTYAAALCPSTITDCSRAVLETFFYKYKHRILYCLYLNNHHPVSIS